MEDNSNNISTSYSENSLDSWTHRIYCVSLPSAKERRSRIKKRFEYHKLTSFLTFVDAIPNNSPIITEYYNKNVIPKANDTFEKLQSTSACFASHLKAIRTYLEDPYSTNSVGVIICEDDILLHNNFIDKYNEIMENLPKTPAIPNAITFSYMLDNVYWGYNTVWVGEDIKKENLFRMKKEVAWGTQMYWLSRKYCYEVLEKYDIPFIAHQKYNIVTSELILTMAGRYLSYPVLALEDSIGSDIRNNDDM